MKKIMLSAFAITALVLGANAQTTSANTSQTVTLNLQNQIDISVLSATGTAFTFASPSDYTTGLTNTSASQFQVRSNKAWAVSVKAAAATFSGPAGNSMPADKLGVRLTGGSTFTQLAISNASLTSGSRGTQTFNVDYNANPGFDYDQGTYTLSVVYTASQQ